MVAGLSLGLSPPACGNGAAEIYPQFTCHSQPLIPSILNNLPLAENRSASTPVPQSCQRAAILTGTAALFYFEGTNMATPDQIISPSIPEGNPQASAGKQAVLLTAEDHQAFDALATAFRFELHPAGPVERALYNQIVLAAWNIERTHRLEAGLAAGGIDPLLSETNAKTLERIASCRMRSERTFHKCLKALQAYKATHSLDEEPVVQNEAKVIQLNRNITTAPSAATLSESGLREFAFIRAPYVRTEPKVGRNEPCPCHSGRKYKQCCLRNEPNSAIASPAELQSAQPPQSI